MLEHLVIRQIRARLDDSIRRRRLPLHERIQYSGQCRIVPHDLARLIHITRHRDKAVSSTGQIDLKPMLPVVDVIERLVVGEVRR